MVAGVLLPVLMVLLMLVGCLGLRPKLGLSAVLLLWRPVAAAAKSITRCRSAADVTRRREVTGSTNLAARKRCKRWLQLSLLVV
jgi:hypothetical protein